MVPAEAVIDVVAARVFLAFVFHESAFQVVFFRPDFAAVAIILTNHRGRIERRIIHARDGLVNINLGFRWEHDGALVAAVHFTLLQVGHNVALFHTLFRYITGEFDALTAEHEEIHGDGTQVRHLHVFRHDVNLAQQVMNEITILDTVFRDDGALGVGAVAHPEDVLGTHIIFDNCPLDYIGGGSGQVLDIFYGCFQNNGIRSDTYDFELVYYSVASLIEQNHIAP